MGFFLGGVQLVGWVPSILGVCGGHPRLFGLGRPGSFKGRGPLKSQLGAREIAATIGKKGLFSIYGIAIAVLSCLLHTLF